MTPIWRCWCWKLELVSSLAMGGALALGGGLSPITAFGDCALAQVIPDVTLGAESSVVTPLAPGLTVDVIEGGATRGANLFHSFEQFSVPTGGAAHFNNALNVQNIISRVTGSSISNIDGLLGANGTANLFLLNPNGIIFGPNARLNIGGSFLGSTASSLNFADGNQFSATAPQTTPLLTVSVPIGLQFGGNPGSIVNQSQAQSLSGETNSQNGPVGLQVPTGQTLALVGGDIVLESGNLTAVGGRIELGSVAGVGEVSLSQTDNSWVIGYDEINHFGDIRLEGGLLVDASGSGGGDVQIQGARLEMTQGANIFADTLGTGAGKEVLVRTTEAVTLSDGSRITADVLGSGTGGNLTVETGRLSISDGAEVRASTFGIGDAGDLTVHASDTVEVSGDNSFLSTNANPGAEGAGGNLTVETGRLSISDGAVVTASTFGIGEAGELTIRARDSVRLVNRGLLSTASVATIDGVTGNITGVAGNITIDTGRLILQDGAGIITSTNGQAAAGDLTIEATDSVSLDTGSSLFTASIGGSGGDLSIETKNLTVQGGSNVGTLAVGQGNAGRLIVEATDSVNITDSSIVTTSSLGVGTGGELSIETRNLTVQNGAGVFTSTFDPDTFNSNDVVFRRFHLSNFTDPLIISAISSAFEGDFAQGDSGNLAVRAREAVNVVNGGYLSTAATGRASGGSLSIETPRLSIQQGDVSTDISGSGDAGSIEIRAADLVEVLNSRLAAETTQGSTGNGGDITIQTQILNIQDTAEVSASSQGSGNAGDLKVEASSIRLDNQGKLRTQTASGEGGNILLQVQDLLLLRRNSLISTEAGTNEVGGGGNGGDITINTDLLVALPSEDSNIIADAFDGQGGNINITAQGIFGIQPREQQTPLSDITASSKLGINGTVAINILAVDPSQGLASFPAELVEASRLIATGCAADEENKFIVTGRGGLPPNPGDTLSGEAVLTNWATLEPEVENRSGAAPSTNPTRERALTQIVEAQGWVINNKGEVVLTANAPNVTPNIPWITPATCHAP